MSEELGSLIEDGYAKVYSCGCLLVDADVSPTVMPCCEEHESQLSGKLSSIRLNFGKYRGKKLEDVPYEYLVWLNDQELGEPMQSRVAKFVSEFQP